VHGAINLQRQLAQLAARHGVTLSQPCRVPLVSTPPDHDALILEGIASAPEIERDRTRFLPRCFGVLPATLPLFLEHDAARPAGTATLRYDDTGRLRIRATVSGEARRFGAFSIGARILQADIHDADSRDFYAEITQAELTEISLTTTPHLATALVLNRMPPSANAAFYGAMQEYFQRVSQVVALLQKGTPNGSVIG
jgi:hypothetical protein